MNPVQKRLLKHSGLDQLEYPPNGIVRGNTIVQSHELSKPTHLILAKLFDIRGPIGTGNRRAGPRRGSLQSRAIPPALLGLGRPESNR